MVPPVLLNLRDRSHFAQQMALTESLMRHAHSNISMSIYTHTGSSKKRAGAEHRGGNDSAGATTSASVGGCRLMCIFLAYRADFPKAA
jgi:hypothetical protein